MASRVAALLLLAVICIGFAAAEIPADCCLSVNDKMIHHIRIQSFWIQEADNRCTIGATVLLTKKGRLLCAPLPSKSKWVKKLISRLQEKVAGQ